MGKSPKQTDRGSCLSLVPVPGPLQSWECPVTVARRYHFRDRLLSWVSFSHFFRYVTAAACVFVFSLPLMGAAKEAAAKAEQRPNIIFVILDALRRDHVGCYGYARDTTPVLDGLAQKGVVIDQLIATSSWTMPGVASMFTSLQPSFHGAVSYKSRMRKGLVTLAGQLAAAGYQTAGITSNPAIHSKFGFNQGFGTYDDFTIPLAWDLNLFEDFPGEGPASAKSFATSPLVNRLALSWLRKAWNRENPYFLFLLYFDPHADYVPPAPYDREFDPDYTGREDGRNMYARRNSEFSERDRKHLVARYDGEILYTDWMIGEFLEQARQMGALENTLIILLADHGEEFWDHGGILHGHTLFEELVRVPCILYWPGVLPAGKRIEAQVSHIDIMPTLLSAAMLPTPDQCQGRSIWQALAADAAIVPHPAFMETEVGDADLVSIRTPGMKVIWDLKSGTRTTYALDSDPWETQQLDTQATAATLSSLLDSYHKETEDLNQADGKADNSTDNHVSGRLLKQLRALGYAH